MRVLVVGARSARQGTGPFVAAALVKHGAQVCAVVGTSPGTVSAARAGLARDSGIDCPGYTDLVTALAESQPDAVALCSPWQFHAEQLAQVAAAHCHCLAEKPLVWPAGREQLDSLLAAFEQRGLLLRVVTQWPHTLPGFRRLHGVPETTPERFTMRLSPISIGPDMVTDAAPHFLSMLQALSGTGHCENVALGFSGEGAQEQLRVSCDYRHGKGSIAADLLLRTCPERPRPAWYEIDGRRANREVELPQYRQFLAAHGQRVALPDPMEQVVASFLQALSAGEGTDGARLRAAHDNLLQLAAAWPADRGPVVAPPRTS